MQSSESPLIQTANSKMNPWIFWCPLIGGIAMIPILCFLLSTHRVNSASLVHIASTISISFSFAYHRINRSQKLVRLHRIINITLSTMGILVALYIIIGTFFVIPFSGYNAKHFSQELRTDLKNAYHHAEEALSKHSNVKIDREEQLRSAGWKPSTDVSFGSADVTAKGGRIVLKHRLLNNSVEGLKPGEGRVSSDGGIIKIEVPNQ